MTDGLPALTLWQPWATLMALGVKEIETRSWRAPRGLVGQRVYLHAAARKVPYVSFGAERGAWHVAPQGWGDYGDRTPVVWRDVTPPDALFAQQVRHPLHLGAMLCSAVLAACIPMVEVGPADQEDALKIRRDNGTLWRCYADRHPAYSDDVTDQAPYGIFEAGRWAWIFEAVEPLPEPVPVRGGQRVWRWRP